MTPTQLRQHIGTEYDILCIEDLAAVCSGAYHLTKILHRHWKPTFEPNERLVFFSGQRPDETLLQHIKRTCEQCDISLSFILVICPYDIQSLVNGVCASDEKFQTLVLDIDGGELCKNYIHKDTICPLPWMHLEIDNNGSIRPCCVSRQTLGNINQDNLQEIFFNQDMRDLRQQMLSGQPPEGCHECWKVESLGLTSNRLRHLALKKKKLLTTYLSRPAIRSLDLKPGSTCNFKCRICNADSSSSHAQEIAQLKRIPVLRHLDWIDNHVGQINDLIDNLENLDLYGGEPFLIKKLTQLVHTIVQKGRASQVRLHYNSNGSIFPGFLLPYWKHFQHVDLHFSIDNIGHRFEIERGGSWTQVEKNIVDLLNQDLANLKISIMPTVNVMNVLYLDELLDWADSLGIETNFNILARPACLSISSLTDRAKGMVLEKYQRNPHSKIREISDAVQNIAGSDGQEFVTFMRHYDGIRHQSFVRSHSEIALAMGLEDTECLTLGEEEK